MKPHAGLIFYGVTPTELFPSLIFSANLKNRAYSYAVFPDEVLDVLRETSRTVLEEEAAKDPYFREAYDSIRAFSAKVNRWHEIQEFKR